MSSKVKSKTPSTKWLEQVGSAIVLLNPKFDFIAASNHWYETFDFDKEDSIFENESIFSIFPEMSYDFKARLEYALDGLKDIQVMCKAKQFKAFEQDSIWYLNPWKDGYGNTIGVVINVKEVSERRNLEFDLHKTKHQLDQKSEIAKIGSWEYDVVNDELIWSDKVKKIHGLSSHYEPVLEHTLSFFKEGASYMTIRRALDNAIRKAQPWNEIVQLITLDGKEKWVNTIGKPKFKDGKCTRILGTLQEVEKDKIKKSLQKKDQPFEYKKVFDSAPTTLVICDYKTGNIIAANQSLLHEFGLEKKEIKGKFFGSFVSLLKTNRLSMARKLLSEGVFDTVKTSFVKDFLSGSAIKIKGTLLNSENGSTMVLVHVQKLGEDFEIRSDSQALDADYELEKLVNFNHMMSHNLKTHATNISLLLGFVDKEVNKNERDNMMRLLNQSTEHLMSEIKVLREMVAIGENKGLKKVELPLNDFILSAEHTLSGQIRKEGAKIFNGVEESLKINVVPVYMESVLNNILANAIKFRKEDKSPVIVINATESEDHVILSIEDNGIGIDLNQYKDKIFALYQTINSTENSGIGLYLAKYQMELMRGEIEVESTVGVGTIFKLLIPKIA